MKKVVLALALVAVLIGAMFVGQATAWFDKPTLTTTGSPIFMETLSGYGEAPDG